MATSPSLLPAPEEAPLTPTVITALITTTAGIVPILLHPASQLVLPNAHCLLRVLTPGLLATHPQCSKIKSKAHGVTQGP